MPANLVLQILLEASDSSGVRSVYYVRVLAEIERDILRTLSQKNDALTQSVRVASFVEYVWIRSGQVRYDNTAFAI